MVLIRNCSNLKLKYIKLNILCYYMHYQLLKSEIEIIKYGMQWFVMFTNLKFKRNETIIKILQWEIHKTMKDNFTPQNIYHKIKNI